MDSIPSDSIPSDSIEPRHFFYQSFKGSSTYLLVFSVVCGWPKPRNGLKLELHGNEIDAGRYPLSVASAETMDEFLAFFPALLYVIIGLLFIGHQTCGRGDKLYLVARKSAHPHVRPTGREPIVDIKHTSCDESDEKLAKRAGWVLLLSNTTTSLARRVMTF